MANKSDEHIVAGLDIPKSVRQINADIKKMEKQLAHVKITGASDMNHAKATNEELQKALSETSKSAKAANADLEKTDSNLENINHTASQTAKLGKSWFHTIKDGILSYFPQINMAGMIGTATQKFREALSELKEADTYLTEIRNANANLSEADLKRIGSNSFSIASKYGKKSADYLSGVREAAHAGYKDVEGIAELSLAAQSTGDITADLANQLILATDNAYEMNGSVAELTKVLDGMNNVTNRNTVNMTELSEGMAIAASTAASFGVDADETTAALGTMITATQESGSEAALAFKAILLNTRQVSDEAQGIDAEGLKKYENACNALNVRLKETRNGVISLRDPMDVLKELSVEYNKLDEGDIRRTNLLHSVGSESGATQLDALLRQWDTYEAMLKQYQNSAGSMASEAAKTTGSWEDSLNRLSNTWTSTVNHIADSDAITTGINALNSLLNIINNISSSIGSLGTIGLGAGLFAGIKNIGKYVQVYGFQTILW